MASPRRDTETRLMCEGGSVTLVVRTRLMKIYTANGPHAREAKRVTLASYNLVAFGTVLLSVNLKLLLQA